MSTCPTQSLVDDWRRSAYRTPMRPFRFRIVALIAAYAVALHTLLLAFAAVTPAGGVAYRRASLVFGRRQQHRPAAMTPPAPWRARCWAAWRPPPRSRSRDPGRRTGVDPPWRDAVAANPNGPPRPGAARPPDFDRTVSAIHRACGRSPSGAVHATHFGARRSAHTFQPSRRRKSTSSALEIKHPWSRYSRAPLWQAATSRSSTPNHARPPDRRLGRERRQVRDPR